MKFAVISRSSIGWMLLKPDRAALRELILDRAGRQTT